MTTLNNMEKDYTPSDEILIKHSFVRTSDTSAERIKNKARFTLYWSDHMGIRLYVNFPCSEYNSRLFSEMDILKDSELDFILSRCHILNSDHISDRTNLGMASLKIIRLKDDIKDLIRNLNTVRTDDNVVLDNIMKAIQKIKAIQNEQNDSNKNR